ncbi:MAG: DUF6115 domain-containing protein [Lachnospiraceae bacterium]
MTIMEIILLIIGIVVFVASFRIPVGREETLTEGQIKATEEEISKLVQVKVDEASTQLSDHMDETVNYAVEKAERSLDRLTNEKIMAVSEYADTVLSDIHKNHEEVVFLYDMLNDKQTHLKNTVKEAEQTAKTVTKKVNEAKAETPKAEESKAEESKTERSKTEEFRPFVIPQIRVEEKKRTDSGRAAGIYETAEKNTIPAGGRKKVSEKKKEEGEVPSKAARRTKAMPELLSTDSLNDGNTDRNSNEAILKLHKEGKSNMAIARELGLGVGEVKLVIDLFKGM